MRRAYRSPSTDRRRGSYAALRERILSLPQHTTELAIRNDMAEIARVRDALDRFAAKEGIPCEVLLQLQVAVDEIVSNVVKYAWPEGGTHELMVRISTHGNAVRVEVIDDGRAFDPLAAPPPDALAPGSKRQPGGRGIRMARQLVDSLEYERADRHNHIVITKRCMLCAPRQ